MESVPHTPFMIVIRSARRKLLGGFSGGGEGETDRDSPDEGKVAVVVVVLVERLFLLLRHLGGLALLRCH